MISVDENLTGFLSVNSTIGNYHKYTRADISSPIILLRSDQFIAKLKRGAILNTQYQNILVILLIYNACMYINQLHNYFNCF